MSLWSTVWNIYRYVCAAGKEENIELQVYIFPSRTTLATKRLNVYYYKTFLSDTEGNWKSWLFLNHDHFRLLPAVISVACYPLPTVYPPDMGATRYRCRIVLTGRCVQASQMGMMAPLEPSPTLQMESAIFFISILVLVSAITKFIIIHVSYCLLLCTELLPIAIAKWVSQSGAASIKAAHTEDISVARAHLCHYPIKLKLYY